MSSVVEGRKQKKTAANDKPHKVQTPTRKSDYVFFLLAVAAVVLVFVFVPGLLNRSGVALLAGGSAISKLLVVVLAVAAGWLCLMPTQMYGNTVSLVKEARIEWRKTVKPDRDTVVKTTMMVLLLVFMFALFIILLDWLFGAILDWAIML